MNCCSDPRVGGSGEGQSQPAAARRTLGERAARQVRGRALLHGARLPQGPSPGRALRYQQGHHPRPNRRRHGGGVGRAGKTFIKKN